MAGDRQVRFDIDVNAAKAEQGLRQFSRAVKQATKESENALDDTSSAADKVAKALTKMAGQMDTELRQAAKAADALSEALGPELTGRMDLEQITADLNRMGLSFEDIEADADKLAAALKEIDGIRIDQANAGLDDMRTKMTGAKDATDRMSDSARGANSALANMIGNSAQTLGGMVGVVGDLGVGIGQMGEYAADAALGGENLGASLLSMAKVAGPIAALSAAMFVASKAIAAMGANSKRTEEMTRASAEAILEQSGAVESLDNALANLNLGDTLTAQQQFLQSLAGTPEEFNKIARAAALLGIDLQGVGDIFEAIEADSEAAVNGLAQAAIEWAGLEGSFTDEELLDIADAMEKAVNQAEDGDQAFGLFQRRMVGMRFSQDQIDTFEAVVRALEDINSAQQDTDVNEIARQQLVYAEAIGHVNEAVAQAVDLARERAGAGADEFDVWKEYVAILNQVQAAFDEVLPGMEGVNEKNEQAAELINAAKDQWVEYQQVLADANDELFLVGEGFDNAAARAEAMAAAFEEANRRSTLTAATEVNDFVDGLEGVADALKELDKVSGVDLNDIDIVPPPDEWQAWRDMPDEAQAVLDALSGFRDSMQSEMAQAFETGGADSARLWASNTIQAVRDMLAGVGITATDTVNQVLEALGLLPSQVETTIDVSIREEAALKLEALMSTIEALRSGGAISAQVALNIAAVAIDDPETALAMATAAIEGAGLTVPAELQIDPASVTAATANVPTVIVPTELAAPDLAGGAVSWFTGPAALDPVVVPAELDSDPVTEGLDEITDADYTATVTAEADTRDATSEFNQFVRTERTAEIEAEATNLGPTGAALNNVANPSGGAREAKIIANVSPASLSVADLHLDYVANPPAGPREAKIFARADPGSLSVADRQIDNVAEQRREAVIYVRTVNTGGGGGGGGTGGPVPQLAATPTAAATAAPTAAVSPVTMAAPTPTIINNNTVTVRAGAIGNRYDVQRAVARAMRQSQRLNGRRVA